MIKHTDPDSPSGFRFELTQDEHDAGLVALITGPISGTLAVPDGTEYDVTEDWIPVRAEHHEALEVAIHRAHREQGNFLDAPIPTGAG